MSPNGRRLASGSDDKTVKLWDVVTGRELRTLTGHSDIVGSVIFSPDGRWLASGSVDKTVKLWDVSTGRQFRTLTGHSDIVRSVAFSPDGRWLASGSVDGQAVGCVNRASTPHPDRPHKHGPFPLMQKWLLQTFYC